MGVPFPRGMGIREAGQRPVEPMPQSNIYQDLGQAAGMIGQEAQGYQQREDEGTKRQTMLDEMVRKRMLAREVHESKVEKDRLDMEIAQEERDKVTQAEERKSGFYEGVSGLDPESPTYKQDIEAELLKHQQVEPDKFYDSKFGKSGVSKPKAHVFVDEERRPWQVSQTFGENTMIPITTKEGVIHRRYMPPKAGQTVYGPEGEAYTLPPGSSRARAITTTGAEGERRQLKKQQISPKFKATIKGKLNKIRIAKKQLANVLSAFKKDSWAFGLGFGMLPTKEGRMFDVAVGALKSTNRALTRVAGEGSMSDMETKLANMALPNRNEPEDVTMAQIKNLAEMLQMIEDDYKSYNISEDNQSNSVTPVTNRNNVTNITNVTPKKTLKESLESGNYNTSRLLRRRDGR